jgi:hypothetical protein
MKADRERCLRCFEILVAAPEPKLIERLTPEQLRLVAGGAAVAVLLVGVLAWRNRPTPGEATAPAQAGRPGAAWNGNTERPPAAAAT